VLVTLPANETAIGKAIAIAMAHPFGVGNSHSWIGTREPRWVDTVAFFCCGRETFERGRPSGGWPARKLGRVVTLRQLPRRDETRPSDSSGPRAL